MSFSADWLALRRPADDRARDPGLLAEAASALRGPVRVLDLGAGTGATMAAMAPVLPRPQHWVLAEHDPALLARAVAPEQASIEPRVVDIAAGARPLFADPPDLVTASAFFDLCGAQIAADLVAHTAAAGAVFYTALSYDGREHWHPPHSADAPVLAAFHTDQARDKGLGPALGPRAVEALSRLFRHHGYTVRTAASDWVLHQPRDAALIEALATGSASAVRPSLGPAADAWLAARREAGPVTVGHLDLLALPPGHQTRDPV